MRMNQLRPRAHPMRRVARDGLVAKAGAVFALTNQSIEGLAIAALPRIVGDFVGQCSAKQRILEFTVKVDLMPDFELGDVTKLQVEKLVADVGETLTVIEGEICTGAGAEWEPPPQPTSESVNTAARVAARRNVRARSRLILSPQEGGAARILTRSDNSKRACTPDG